MRQSLGVGVGTLGVGSCVTGDAPFVPSGAPGRSAAAGRADSGEKPARRRLTLAVGGARSCFTSAPPRTGPGVNWSNDRGQTHESRLWLGEDLGVARSGGRDPQACRLQKLRPSFRGRAACLKRFRLFVGLEDRRSSQVKPRLRRRCGTATRISCAARFARPSLARPLY